MVNSGVAEMFIEPTYSESLELLGKGKINQCLVLSRELENR